LRKERSIDFALIGTVCPLTTISILSQIAEHHASHGFLILGPRRKQSKANLHDCGTNVYIVA
jgi:hypothetical protein